VAAAPAPAPPLPAENREPRRRSVFDHPSSSDSARLALRRRRQRWIGLCVVVVLVLLAIRLTPILDLVTGGRADPDDLSPYVDLDEQEGLIRAAAGDTPGSAVITVMTKKWPIPSIADRNPADVERQPWEKATDALAVELRTIGDRPWNAHWSRDLSPDVDALLHLVVARLIGDGVKVIHYEPKNQTK
jgi:hypothetical protein